jgi:hypothetical protein
MRGRHSKLRGDEQDSIYSGGHLTDEAFLRSLDGELSLREASGINAHVQSCWSCRSRKQAIADSIADLVDYENAMAAPFLPPSLDQRAIFLARLDATAIEMGHPSRLKGWFNRASQVFRFSQINQFAQIAVVLAVVASALIFYFLRTPPVVSADELLSRAAASEARSLKTATEPVVVQKLRISMDKKSFTRTVYRDVTHNRIASRTEESRSGETLAKAAYSKSSLDWDSLLDAEEYRRWRATRPASKDTVMRLGDDRLKLETTSSVGPIIEAELTVRAEDYHAVEESFRFQDHSQIEIAELSYSVIPFASLPGGIFGVPTQLAEARVPVATIVRSVLPSNAELAEAEVKAESVLHDIGADLGEQINITTRVGHEVLIDGVVGDDARKQELLLALREVPHARLHILTIDEAARQSPSSTAASPVLAYKASARVLIAAPPLLDAELSARFSDKDQRIAFVNETLSLAQLASARAWALNRLADRHSPEEVAVLNGDARRQLQELLADHVSALREDISSLQNQLAEILSGSSNTPAANTSQTAPLEFRSADALEFPEDWRDRVRRIHSSTEAIHEAVAALLTSSQPSDQNDAKAIEVNLRTSLTQLQTELQALAQKVHKTDLK